MNILLGWYGKVFMISDFIHRNSVLINIMRSVGASLYLCCHSGGRPAYTTVLHRYIELLFIYCTTTVYIYYIYYYIYVCVCVYTASQQQPAKPHS